MYIYIHICNCIYIYIDGGSIVEGWVQGSAFRARAYTRSTVSIAEDYIA